MQPFDSTAGSHSHSSALTNTYSFSLISSTCVLNLFSPLVQNHEHIYCSVGLIESCFGVVGTFKSKADKSSATRITIYKYKYIQELSMRVTHYNLQFYTLAVKNKTRCATLERSAKKWVWRNPVGSVLRSLDVLSFSSAAMRSFSILLLCILLAVCELQGAAEVRICAFNLHNFGESKAKNSNVMHTLTKVRCSLSVLLLTTISRSRSRSSWSVWSSRFSSGSCFLILATWGCFIYHLKVFQDQKWLTEGSHGLQPAGGCWLVNIASLHLHL